MRRRLLRTWLSASLLGSTLLGCQAIKGPQANQPLLMSKQPVDGKFGPAGEPAQFASAEPKAPPLPMTAFAAAPPANLGPPTSPGLRPSDPQIMAAPTLPDTASPQRRAPVTATPAVRPSTRADVPAAPAVRTNPTGDPLLGPSSPTVQPNAAPTGRTNPPADPLLGTTLPAQPNVAPAVPPTPPAVAPAPVIPLNPAPPTSATSALPIRFQGTYGHDAEYTTLQGVLDRHYHGHVYLRYCDPKVEDPWGGKVCLEDDPRLTQFKEGDVVRVEGAIVPEVDQNRHHAWKHYPRYRIKSIELAQPRN